MDPAPSLSHPNLFLDAERRLRPGWQFILSVPLFLATAGIALRTAARFGSPQTPQFDSIYRPLHLVLLVAGFAAMLRFLNKTSKNVIAAQGLNVHLRWIRDTLKGILLGGGMIVITVSPIVYWGGYSCMIYITRETVEQAVVLIWILLSAAMLEEAAFRGYPFQRLVESLSCADIFLRLPRGALAAIGLSLAFGAAHLGNAHSTLISSINTVLVGILLSAAYLRTQGLWLPFGVHFGWNFTLGMVFGLPVSGVTMFSVLAKGQAKGPLWLTGGDYGPEGSVVTAGALLVGLLVLIWTTKIDSLKSNPEHLTNQ